MSSASRTIRALKIRGLVSLAILAAALCRGQVITSIAGNGNQGFMGDGGPANQAWISFPEGIAVDKAGNVYFADTGNLRVRAVNTAGIIGTFAGNGMEELSILGGIGDGGPSTAAGFDPGTTFQGVAVDAQGNLYIADGGNFRVRKVSGGFITTFAGGGGITSSGDGGPANQAGLRSAAGVAVDNAGNVYIADQLGGVVRMVNTQGIISTVAGGGGFTSSGDGGPATKAGIANGPLSVAVDNQGNLYIAEGGGARVRKVNSAGIISTFAGNGTNGFSGDGGPAINAQFADLRGIVTDNAGNVYISDYDNFRVRKVDASGIITTIAGAGLGTAGGDGGLPTDAGLQPSGLAMDASGNLYISDYGDNRVRKITFKATPPGLSASAYSLYFADAPNFGSGAQQLTISSAGPPLS
jgi:sugar lactone lactonase YvrE